MFAFAMPGPMEMIILGAIAVLLFGRRLPDVARSFGQSLMSFKKGFKEVEMEVQEMEKIGQEATHDISSQINDVTKTVSKSI